MKNVLTEVSYNVRSATTNNTGFSIIGSAAIINTGAFVKKTAAQRKLYESGNELAAYAAKQINYHIMGYYPITPSTQIAENLDLSGARGEHNIRLIAAEGEHSAAGICYGASAGGGRVFNATSANGLLYALEQFPVQSAHACRWS